MGEQLKQQNVAVLLGILWSRIIRKASPAP